MDTQWKEILAGRIPSRMMPFFWQHGEGRDTLLAEMRAIWEDGFREICVESRPHPDFLGETWWRDMDLIMEEARKRDMRVWLLDDSHFPTGFANGAFKEHPELSKVYLACDTVDVVGPLKSASILLKPFLQEGDAFLGASIAAHTEEEGVFRAPLVDITPESWGDVLHLDIPAGIHRVFLLRVTRHGGGMEHYGNLLDPAAVKLLIDTVYEPHYTRYQDDFGKTFAGFFSDEPEMGNTLPWEYDTMVGRKAMVLPWSQGAQERLQGRYPQLSAVLPCLFWQVGPDTGRFRYAYMDTVTRLYSESFSGQLAAWCRAHNVSYIGHVLEDNNLHGRLGHGAGHFFRAMAHQDMAGLDVVLQQIRPGMDSGYFRWSGGIADAEFFHYGLAKLGASLGHIDPGKNGQVMCEIFGAYGWSEGCKLMKWLLDHMLVRGVNTFVPHAYSPKAFPDPDCPPHFLAGGNNPQHRFFGDIIRYGQRLSHLFSGGKPVMSAAILYHAEAEWYGDAMLCQKPMRMLMQSQIDADFVPCDAFTPEDPYGLELVGSRLSLGGIAYHCLIVPAASALPAAVARFVAKAQRTGFPVLFLQRRPTVILDGEPGKERELLAALRGCPVLTPELLVETLRSLGIYELRTRTYEPTLRAYHYRREGFDGYMFFNEHPYDAVSTTVFLPQQGPAYRYDAMENTLTRLDLPASRDGLRVPLRLPAYQSEVLLFGAVDADVPLLQAPADFLPRNLLSLAGPWTVAMADAQSYPRFGTAQPLERLEDLSLPQHAPDFSGTFRYETRFSYVPRYDRVELDLGRCYESVEAYLNGRSLGRRLTPPYRFDVTGLLREGENHLAVEVTGTLIQQQKDRFSAFAQVEPVGLLGEVVLREGQ